MILTHRVGPKTLLDIEIAIMNPSKTATKQHSEHRSAISQLKSTINAHGNHVFLGCTMLHHYKYCIINPHVSFRFGRLPTSHQNCRPSQDTDMRIVGDLNPIFEAGRLESLGRDASE